MYMLYVLYITMGFHLTLVTRVQALPGLFVWLMYYAPKRTETETKVHTGMLLTGQRPIAYSWAKRTIRALIF